MGTVLLIIFAFFAGAICGLFLIAMMQRKLLHNRSDSSNKKELSKRIQDNNKFSKKIMEDLQNVLPAGSANSTNIRNIEQQLLRIIDYYTRNEKQQDISDYTEKVPEININTAEVSDNISPAPAVTVPVTAEETKTVTEEFSDMEQVFETVQKLRNENPEYRIYNEYTESLEYSSDPNSSYIIYRKGSDIMVLPNYNAPFARKRISDNIYKCGLNWIELTSRIVPCYSDNSGIIIKQGEIFD